MSDNIGRFPFHSRNDTNQVLAKDTNHEHQYTTAKCNCKYERCEAGGPDPDSEFLQKKVSSDREAYKWQQDADTARNF